MKILHFAKTLNFIACFMLISNCYTMELSTIPLHSNNLFNKVQPMHINNFPQKIQNNNININKNNINITPLRSNKYKQNDKQHGKQELENDKKLYDEAITYLKAQLQCNGHDVNKGMADIEKLHKNDIFRYLFFLRDRTPLLQDQLIEINCEYLYDYHGIINSIFLLVERIEKKDNDISLYSNNQQNNVPKCIKDMCDQYNSLITAFNSQLESDGYNLDKVLSDINKIHKNSYLHSLFLMNDDSKAFCQKLEEINCKYLFKYRETISEILSKKDFIAIINKDIFNKK